MNLTRFAIRNRVFVLFVVAALFVAGLSKFLTMPRREDPEINIRTAVIVTRWPGATARKIEDLVTDPIETAVKRMDGVEEIRSDSRNGQSIVYVDIDEDTPGHAVEQAWDQLRVKVGEAEGLLPDGCQKPYVNSDFGDVYDVVLALYQGLLSDGSEPARRYTYRELEIFAETVQDELKNLAQVGRVDLFGIQDERIYLEVDAADWAKLDLTTNALQRILESRNIVASGGQVDTETARFNVKPTGEFTSVEEIDDVTVAFVDGEIPVRLGDLPIDVVRGYVDPMGPHVLHATPEVRSDRCLLVGVSLKSGQNVVGMGSVVAERLERLQASVLPPDVRVERINNLPEQVDTLVKDFVSNLYQAILLVLVVALLMMGWRPAVIMAAAIPLCMIASIFVMGFFGVELEQFSIASLIIALGMLVDNAIVVSDNVLRELEEGGAADREAKERAAVEGASSLATPILTSTLTTVCAFLPMLTIVGNTGEYVRSLPIVVSVTLLMSYLVAMMVTPILCTWLLKPQRAEAKPYPGIPARVVGWIHAKLRRGGTSPPPEPAPVAGPASDESDRPRGLGAVYDRAIRWCLRHRATTMLAAAALVVASLRLVPLIGSEFFPGGVRDQVWVHVWLPEGSSIEGTASKAGEVLDIIERTSRTTVGGDEVERLRSATAFVGMGGPRLNLVSSPEQELPNYALVLLNTSDPSLSGDWADEIRTQAQGIAGARIDVRAFKLGPYIENSVEFRVMGEDHDLLRASAEEILAVLRDTPGTVNPFHDWFNDGYVAEVRVDPERANLARVTNQSVAHTMDSLISGGYLTTFREGDHTVPVVLRIRGEKRSTVLDDLSDVYVDGFGQKVPLESVAELVTTWEPACIARKDTIRTISVGCQTLPGHLPNSVAQAARPRVEEVVAGLPTTYVLEDGGELEQTAESQAKIAGAFTISGLLILIVLIAQYNSVVKPLIVLATVPLALVGALIGLFTTGNAIGFMPSLGIVSLAGVVINNAIILVDFIENYLKEGRPLTDAVADAGRLRMRPIVLTTLTTIGGLLPLALLAGPMWAGMAWAMIFGLALSTGLTLLVIPTLYAACFERFKLSVR